MKIKDLNKRKKVVIYGENHTVFDEVEKIRNLIVKQSPDVILHELYWEDEEFYNSVLPNTEVLPLEDEVRNDCNSLKDQFFTRENSMIDHLNNAIENYDNLAVVIGDTHLRTQKTDELGEASPIQQWANKHQAKIIRSEHREIK